MTQAKVIQTRLPKELQRPKRPFKTLGVEGVKVSNGFVHDEFLPQLVGDRGRRVYRQMRDNDASISAILFAVEMLFRAVKWSIVSSSKGPEAEARVEFLESALFDDMEHSWDDFIASVVSMLTYGWQYTEVVYKRRMGPTSKNPSKYSKYSDGLIGVRKLADRSQETLYRWEMDDYGVVYGMWQWPPNGGETCYIPIGKALLFRPHMHKGSPEGRSVLRSAYRSWYLLKNIQEIEAIAIERELKGLPVISIPNDVLNGTDAASLAAKAEYLKIVNGLKLNHQSGVLLPSDTYCDAEGKPTNIPQVKLELLSASGRRAIDTGSVVKRYQADIARTILADFIMLGGSDRGSFALSKSKTDLFVKALEGWLESIAQVINSNLIPKLWALNGFDFEGMPSLVPGRIVAGDLEGLGSFIESLFKSGIPVSDEATQNYLRDIAGLPNIVASTGEPDPDPDPDPDPGDA